MANTNQTRNRIGERIFIGVCLFATVLPIAILAYLFADILISGLARIDYDFLTGYPSRKADQAGIFPGLVGSFYMIVLAALFSLPLGVGAAIFLEEYVDRKNIWLTRINSIIEINIGNLAGVPSVIYGLLGLEVFARILKMDRSLIAGSLTMSLLILPVVVLSARETLRTVPVNMHEAGIALGASRWQVIRHIVLPMALPGILTGAILSISRAIGEAAPLLVLGAVTYITFIPESLDSPFTVLPLQIFNWVSRPQAAFATNAAAGIVVLLAMLITINGSVAMIRNKLESQVR